MSIRLMNTKPAASADATAAPDRQFVRVGTRDELRNAPGGVRVVRGADRPIAVFLGRDGMVTAVDNRCPHMGFPLHKGTIEDGILTCHWHEARFDLASGCTFDLFADDVPVFDVEIRDNDVVWVSALPRQSRGGDAAGRYAAQLQKGMEQNVALIQAKAIIGLLRSRADVREIVRPVALFGTRNQDGWNGNGGGMTFLTCAANLAPLVSDETATLALFQGTAQAANDCANQPPRRDRYPLNTRDVPLSTLKRWLLHWTRIRHRDAAERTLLTAISNGASPEALCDLLFSAATERFYADGGHVLDEINKAAELLDLIGWEHAASILPAVVGHLVSSRGGEEIGQWRHPVDLVAPLNVLADELPTLLQTGAGKTWNDVSGLAHALLGGDDPLAGVTALKDALAAGARPIQAAHALAYAAGLRVARFSASNEIGDWVTVLHTFTYCNALHQALKRCPDSPLVLRGVFHGAVAVYLDRFLNVPPARLPGEQRGGEEENPEANDADALLSQFLVLLDGQQKGQPAARVVACYLERGHPLPALFDTLVRAAMREDANFHTIQMLEAGIRQFHEWGPGTPQGAHLLFAVARYLAAHAPTRRVRLQTATIALRLHRGDNLFEEETPADA